MINSKKDLILENELTSFSDQTIEKKENMKKNKFIFKNNNISKNELRKRNFIKKKIRKNSLRKIKRKIDYIITKQIDDLNFSLIFKKKYPLTFEREKLKIFYKCKEKRIPKINFVSKKKKINLDVFLTDQKKLKEESTEIRKGTFFSFSILKRIFNLFVFKNLLELDLFLNFFENQIPYFIFSEIIYFLKKFFNLENFKKKLHNPKNEEEKKDTYLKEFKNKENLFFEIISQFFNLKQEKLEIDEVRHLSLKISILDLYQMFHLN